MNADIRKQVMAQIIITMAGAEAKGQDAIKEARRVYPGTPDTVLYEAWTTLDMDRTEAWWRSLEKTIDGELITNGLQISGEP